MKNTLLVLMSLMTLWCVSVPCCLSSIEKITNEVVSKNQQNSINVQVASEIAFPDIDQATKSSLYEAIASYAPYYAAAFAGVGVIAVLRLFQKYALSLVKCYPFLLRPVRFLVFVMCFFLWNDANIKALATVMAAGVFAQYFVSQFIDFLTKNDADIHGTESARVVAPSTANSLAGTAYALNVVGVAAFIVAIFFRFVAHRFDMIFGDDVPTHMARLLAPVRSVPSAAAAA